MYVMMEKEAQNASIMVLAKTLDLQGEKDTPIPRARQAKKSRIPRGAG